MTLAVACCVTPAPRLFSSGPVALSPPSSSSSYSSPPPRSTTTTNTHLYAPPPTSQHSFLVSLLSPLGARGLPNPDVLDVRTAEKALTHKSGIDKQVLYGRRGPTAASEDRGQETQGEGGRIGHNEKLAFVGASRVCSLCLVRRLRRFMRGACRLRELPGSMLTRTCPV